ncbi:MAG TPA: response regulator [Pyrinomonadaceae bacterium]|jgi:signal transduction histidine kinase|nr:response regulator [Pyrinomonadaceae bacterium]
MNNPYHHSGHQPASEDVGSTPTFPNEARLLVVDDEESLRITTAAILEKEGYIVDTASSGDEAISLLQKLDYDLVLTDLHMEGGDGLSVLCEIRRQAPLTISVVLTGFASVESAIAALQEGAYDYLVKPCDIDNMRHTIRRGVDHRRLMLAEQKARADLKQLNRDLEQRIEERTAQLTKANEELADANRAKDVFLATLSHELRTPLTPVVGWIKLLRSASLDTKGVAQALDAIERNAWLQSRLIDDLLDTSRIATGKLHFEPRPTDLNAAVCAALDTVKASAASRSINLSVQLSPKPLIVIGEPVRLQQIAWNLISNAIKFTEPGGSVTVTTENNGNEAMLIVEDTGIGISPEFLPHVFDRFRQADGSTSRVHGGLGLGLAIAHALTKMHQGQLTVESAGVGCGARFKLAVGFVPESVVDADTKLQKTYSLSGMEILIVEDSEDTLALLSTIFGQEGAIVTTASSADEALNSVVVKRPGLIVSDIGMPDTDGYQFLKQVKVLPGMDEVPAIAISGYASEEDRARALDVGYLALVAKPIDVEDLFGIIQQLIHPTVPAPN